MAKTALKSETFEMPAFDTSGAIDQMRSFAEKGMEKSKDSYAKFKSGAEDAQKTMEQSFETAKSVSGDLSLKAITAMRAYAEASFSHMEALLGVKSVSELMELQTSFLRKRVEMTIEQAKDMQSATTKAVETLSAPVKSAMEKTIASATTELKAA